MSQYCLKFDTNKRVGIFVQNKCFAYGTLRFANKTSALNVYKLGIALVNNKCFVLE